MEFDKRIIELESLISRKQSLMRKLDSSNKELSVFKIRRQQLIEQLKVDNVSLTTLDSNSIVDLWFSSIASNKAKLSKNEHDYKLINIIIENINNEINELSQKLKIIYTYEEEYQQLLRQLEQSMNQSNEFMRLREHNKQINEYKVYIKDINEVIMTGNQLSATFNYLHDNLEKAKKWKALEIFGKGILANFSKDSYIKEAEEKVKNIHYLALKFARELILLNQYLNIHINLKELTDFSSYFSDKLYYDMTNHKRMTNIIDFIKNGSIFINDSINYLSLIKEDYIQKIINLDKKFS